MTTPWFYRICQRWMSSKHQNDHFRKQRITYRRIGTYSLIVTFAACGSLLWIEVEAIRNKLSSSGKLGVFDFDKSTNPYIYISSKELDIRAKSEDIKKKYLDPEKIKKASWFPWLQSHSQDPWTLLKLTRSGDRKTRWLGVKAIAEMEDWQDYQYRYVAQACDGRTLVGLARSPGVGDRFFLPPPPLHPLGMTITSALRTLLTSLPLDSVDRCVEHFTSLALERDALPDNRTGWLGVGPSLDPTDPTPRPLSEERLQLYYLEALEAHSQNMDQCCRLVRQEGLTVLRHLVAEYCGESDPLIPRQIARIIGNIALSADLHSEIIRLGWVPILARWTSHTDLELSHLAGRALMNLDGDFLEEQCEEGVYVLHPVHRRSDEPLCDVVFVHGVRGGPFKTWRQRDRRERSFREEQSMCWPKDWLARDCPNTRILTVEFDTHVSEWYVRCPYNKESRTIESRGRSLLEKLHRVGVGSRPVVWVGHSMGGLLIKQLLVMSESDPTYHQMAALTAGLVFYSVPHHGSTLVDRSHQAWYLVYPSVEMQQLKRDSPQLEVLQERFLQLMKNRNVPCVSFGETEKTSVGKNLPRVHLVPTDSSNPGYGEFHPVPTNHINICKPENKSSCLYTEVLHLVKHIMLQSNVKRFLQAGITFDKLDN